MSDSLWPHGLQHTRFPFPLYLPDFAQTHVHWVGMQLNPFSSCLQSFPESVFSNESVPHFRQTNFWSFISSISPFNEYSRLTSFTFNWFDLLAVQGIPKVFSSMHSSILLSGNCDPKSSQSLPLTLPYEPNVFTNLDSLFLKCVLYSQSHWKLCFALHPAYSKFPAFIFSVFWSLLTCFQINIWDRWLLELCLGEISGPSPNKKIHKW